ncbi:MAG: DUF2625 family protein [Pirellulaceae bacterium]
MRSLDELLDKDASVIRRIRQWTETADVECKMLPPSEENANILLQIQKSTDTIVGALAYETGGVLVDNGWLRFLGSGHPQLLRNLANWNEGRSQGFCLVADDVTGGFFAINEGAWEGEADRMYYWAPDNLEWEPIGFGFEDFFQWCLTPYVADFYQNLRWSTWKQDIRELTGESCFSFCPFLWTQEGSLRKSRRQAIPVEEAFDLKVAILKRLQQGGD